MKKYLIICLIFFLYKCQSSSNQKIINHLENINSVQLNLFKELIIIILKKGNVYFVSKENFCEYYDTYNKILFLMVNL